MGQVMEEMRASKRSGGVLPFVIGFLITLVLGWAFIPGLFYTKMEQPVRFSHQVHVDGQGMTCDQCHLFREDGSFAGLPSNEECGMCHYVEVVDDPTDTAAVKEAAEMALMSADEANIEAERAYLENYLVVGKEVPWLVYQYQPDNVFFSHKAHEIFECTECHPDLATNDTPPPYYRNWLSGYSKQTMKMWKCERCHAENGVSNACYVCHK